MVLKSYLRNPWTGQPWKYSEFWDLVYRPGNIALPNYFFSSQASAAVDEPNLFAINTGRVENNPYFNHWGTGSNCQDNHDGHGSMRCIVGTQSSNFQIYQHGDSRIRALAFTGAGDNPNGQPPTYHRHQNLMSYAKYDAELSPSQIHFILGALRHDMPITEHVDSEQPSATHWGYRNVLGQHLNREPAEMIDFDGDGLRDLAVFQMDTTPEGTNYEQGRFRVLLSSNGYNKSQEYVMDFGRLGDVPVLADFNGDNVTDFAVWRTGGPGAAAYSTQGTWVWCSSNKVGSNPATHSCTTPTQVAFGRRDEIPFPGMAFSSTASDRWLTVYRPSTGVWSWRKTTVAGTTSRTLGGVGQIPLPGVYSLDFLTDLAVYNPATATFQLLTSENSWNGTPTSATLSSVWQTNDPATSGLLGQPQRGAWRPVTLFGVRKTFQLFSPIDGSWETVSSPLANPITTKLCSSVPGNSSEEVPVTGLFDRNGDNLYDYAKVRRDASDMLSVYLIDATASGCSSNAALTISGLPSRTLVFFVRDMTGDGKHELMLLDPLTMTWTWRTSESGYTLQGGNRQFGDESIAQYMLPL